jgi:hypothetical protein
MRKIALGALCAVTIGWTALFATNSGVLVSAREYRAGDLGDDRPSRFAQYATDPIGKRCTYLTALGPRDLVAIDSIAAPAGCPTFTRKPEGWPDGTA